MKTKLLFTKNNYKVFYMLLAFCLFFSYGWSQNLMQNGTCDDWTNTTSDNADAYDMTPNNTIVDNSGATVTSPYQVVWDNDALEDWLEVFYLGSAGSLDEQPGSTASGAGGTRGVKLYDDGDPVITGSSRRLYQKVIGLTIGNNYTFSVDSRSEAMGTPSEVYMLNTEISGEAGLNANGGSDTSVDGFTTITTDYDGSIEANVFITTSFTFTATNTFVVVYVRSLNSVDDATEVFYDNFSLVPEATASLEDILANKFRIFPNPANDYIQIESKEIQLSSIEIFNLLGEKLISETSLENDRLNISNLSSGVYLLKVNADEKSFVKKIVVE